MRLEAAARAERFEAALDVRIDLKNRGETDARPLAVFGELLGETATLRLEEGVPAGRTTEAHLRFRSDSIRPGLHVLLLRLGYPRAPGGAEPLEWLSCLPLAVDRETSPSVRIVAPDVLLETAEVWRLGFEATDGRPHDVRVRIGVPKGLGASPLLEEVRVPARGPVLFSPTLFRGGSPRGAHLEAWVLVEPEDSSAAVFRKADVTILPDPALLPRIRAPLLGVALVLLLATAAIEIRRRLGL